ncbi:MAG: hypothetical protein LUD74_00875 [Tannerellaceae bacterium]|nr:hypothetical protein [Tannerellaceae bacterium]
MEKRNYITGLATLLLSLIAFQGKATDIFGERVYIQTDKSVYLAGEIVWLKAYVTDLDGKPSDLSKIAYVELLKEATAVSQVKLEVEEGTGNGWLVIPETVATGNYRLLAYTRNMLNEDEHVFSEKVLSVINTFRTEGEPQLENLVYEESKPDEAIAGNTISLQTDAGIYQVRANGKLQLSGLPANVHTMAVSIAGCEISTGMENQHIVHWKQTLPALSPIVTDKYYLPEYEGHIIAGKLIDLETEQAVFRPHVVSPMIGFVGDQIRLFGGRQFTDGSVEFYTKRIMGMHELAAVPYSIVKNRYRIDISSPFYNHTAKEIPSFQVDSLWKDELLTRSVGLQVLSSYMGDSLMNIIEQAGYLRRKPDWSYLLDEYTRFTRMEEVVIEFIPGLRFRRIDRKRVLSILMEDRNQFTSGNSLIMLDGIPIQDAEVIFNYNPLLVKRIDIYRGNFVFGGQYFDGIVTFTTYKNDYPDLQTDNTLQFFDYEGTQPYRHFYAPAYITEEERKSRIPDYRHTLLWIPEVKTGGATSISIPFTTSDLPGEYLVKIEGVTTDGQPIYGTKKIKVTP